MSDIASRRKPLAAGRQPAAAGRRRTARRTACRRVLLLSPVLLLLGFAFLLPVALFLLQSVKNDEVRGTLPETTALLAEWDGEGLPSDAAFESLARELLQASRDATIGSLARRLNFQVPGMRSLLMRTARNLEGQAAPGRAELIAADPAWGEHATWALLRQEGAAFTLYYLLAALDLERKPDEGIVAAPADRTSFVGAFTRTFTISATVMLLCLALGYPVAWGMANSSPRTARIMMILVLLPFWMSLLVRTTGWIILLQSNGPVNGALTWLGWIDKPLPLMYSRAGVLIAMTHILLPFMVLPIYSIMRGIPPIYMRAASSLGAAPFRAFLHAYLPQSLPGVAAGCLLTWILSIGYYITPALVGGPTDQMISYFIAFYTNQSINWGLAAALAAWLLLATLLLLLLFRRAVDPRRLGGRRHA